MRTQIGGEMNAEQQIFRACKAGDDVWVGGWKVCGTHRKVGRDLLTWTGPAKDREDIDLRRLGVLSSSWNVRSRRAGPMRVDAQMKER